MNVHQVCPPIASCSFDMGSPYHFTINCKIHAQSTITHSFLYSAATKVDVTFCVHFCEIQNQGLQMLSTHALATSGSVPSTVLYIVFLPLASCVSDHLPGITYTSMNICVSIPTASGIHAWFPSVQSCMACF